MAGTVHFFPRRPAPPTRATGRRRLCLRSSPVRPFARSGMESDWSAEIGQGLPVIEVDWPGFVSLRDDVSLLTEITEAMHCPALGFALMELNGPVSRVMTSKCDVWRLGADDIDPDEFNASPEDAQAGCAVYLDVTSLSPEAFDWFPAHEVWARAVVARLQSLVRPEARADLVVRQAARAGKWGFGLTLYIAGCGSDPAAAQAALGQAAAAVVAFTMENAPTVRASSSIG